MKPHLFRFGEFVVERHCLEICFDEEVVVWVIYWGEICFNFIFCVYYIEEIDMSRKVTMRSSMTNRPTCGGPKKAGLAPRGTNFMMGVKTNHVFRGTPFAGKAADYPMSCRGGGSTGGGNGLTLEAEAGTMGLIVASTLALKTSISAWKGQTQKGKK